MNGAALEEASGAGGWALKGFDYQVDVSTWLALDLMVGARLTPEMILEHVNEEDVEADIEDFEPTPVADTIPMRGYRLIVQAKRSTGDAWTEARFISLLEHGTKRKSAKTRLETDPTARYLLVTSAALNRPVRNIGIRRAGAWPAASKVSPNIAAVGKDVAGRVAVIGNEDDERLVTDIKELLIERFRVPFARWQDCLKALRNGAWARMRGHAGGRWTRGDVERVILEYHGYLLGAPELESYVKPTNWGDLKQALDTNHAVMIVGQSGSGKTMTSDALWHQLREEIPGLQRVHITHGPDQLRADTTLPPVLFDVEDPWGRFRFEPESRPWNDQLAAAFHTARHDRLFVATSRLDVAMTSRALDTVHRWRVSLDAEHYGKRERQQLYRRLARNLPPELRAFAHFREDAVLIQLGLPLELRKFFDALPGLDRDELKTNPAAALAHAIEQAHRDSIERTVIEQVEARDAVKAAAILWALIKPHGRLSADVLRSMEDAFADADPALEDSIDALVNSFVTARNFRQGADGSLGYYHGKVEAGIEAVLARHRQAVRSALGTLVVVLIARDDDMGGTWGTETAAEIMRLSDRIQNTRPRVNRVTQDRLDQWLEQQLHFTGHVLSKHLDLAASVGSPRANLAELARWLAYRPDRGFTGFLMWRKPEKPDAWYARLRADSQVRAVLDAFVRTVLPTDQTGFPKQFARDVEALAGDLTDAFLDAAQVSVGYGYFRNDDVIAEGALADLDRFELVVDAAVAILQPTEAELARDTRDHLSIINGEVSEDYAEHLSNNDDGHTAGEYLQAFVDRMRAECGWRSIAAHRHVASLRGHWLRMFTKEETVPFDELDGAFGVANASDDEKYIWAALIKHWDSRFSERLVRRVIDGHAGPDVRMAALDCMIDRIPDCMADVVVELQATGQHARMAQLAIDLTNCVERRSDSRAAFLESLPDSYRQFANAVIALTRDELPAVSAKAIEEIAAIADVSEDVRVARTRIASHLEWNAADDVRWIFVHSNESDHVVSAVEAAIARDLADEVETALDHKFAHAAARALTAITEPLPAPLPAIILDCAAREQSPVRKALVAQLKIKPHAHHLNALLLLVADEWSKWAPRATTDDGDYPIARAAAEAIAALSELPDAVLDQLIDLAKATEDTHLMSLLLSCVVKHGDQDRQAQIVNMSRRGRRLAVGRAAAYALFDQHDRLSDQTVESISTKMVLRLPASIAGYLTATIGFRGTRETIEAISEALAASDDRRIFLSLLALAVRDRNPAEADLIASRLPDGHPARLWAEGSDAPIDRTTVIDLGDASAVKEAYSWMPQPEK